jgi:hypothetical protein
MPSNTKQTDDCNWYDVDIVVELLIHETERGQRYAPEIGNLCVGFTTLTLDGLGQEIDDIRETWPFIFPKTTETKDILKIVKKKYPAYEEILALRDAS